MTFNFQMHELTTDKQHRALTRPQLSSWKPTGTVLGVSGVAYTMQKGDERAVLYPNGLLMAGPPVASWQR